MIAKNRRILPYVGLALYRNKPTLEVHLGTNGPPRRFPATGAGIGEAVACLADSGAATWLCASSLDFPGDYGLSEDVDLRQVLADGVAKLRPPQPAGWWVVAAAAEDGDLMSWGRDTGRGRPHGTEEEAFECARKLADDPVHVPHRIYIVKIFADGRLAFEEWGVGG